MVSNNSYPSNYPIPPSLHPHPIGASRHLDAAFVHEDPGAVVQPHHHTGDDGVATALVLTSTGEVTTEVGRVKRGGWDSLL